MSAAGTLIDDDDPGVARIDPNPPPGDHADRFRVELVLEGVDRPLELAPLNPLRHRQLALQDRRAGVDPLVDDVDGDPGRLDPRLQRLADRVEPREGRQQGRVDVDHPVAEAPHEGRAEQLHVAGQDDEVGRETLDPVADRVIPCLTVHVLGSCEDRGLDPGRPGPLQRPRRGLVRADADHLDLAAAVQAVEDRLQVGPGPRGEDDDAEGAHGRIFSQ
jgi:hypothetical protein